MNKQNIQFSNLNPPNNLLKSKLSVMKNSNNINININNFISGNIINQSHEINKNNSMKCINKNSMSKNKFRENPKLDKSNKMLSSKNFSINYNMCGTTKNKDLNKINNILPVTLKDLITEKNTNKFTNLIGKKDSKSLLRRQSNNNKSLGKNQKIIQLKSSGSFGIAKKSILVYLVVLLLIEELCLLTQELVIISYSQVIL